MAFDDGLRLDDQLCAALYNASRAMTGCYRPLLDTIGLTYSQYLVMMILWERDEVTMGHLGELLHLDSGTLSPLVKRLEGMGHLIRRRRPEDERTVLLTVTPSGARLHDRAAAVQREVEAVTGLDRAALVALRDQLNALADTMRAAEAGSAA